MQHRYQAKPLYYSPKNDEISRISKGHKDEIFFASSFEFKVYQELVRLVGASKVLVQIPIKVKEKTLIYPTLYWRCDFRILNPHKNEYLNIEAKGLPTQDFKRNMQYLEFCSPVEFTRLLIVVSDHSPKRIDKKITAWKLPEAIDYLIERGYQT